MAFIAFLLLLFFSAVFAVTTRSGSGNPIFPPPGARAPPGLGPGAGPGAGPEEPPVPPGHGWGAWLLEVLAVTEVLYSGGVAGLKRDAGTFVWDTAAGATGQVMNAVHAAGETANVCGLGVEATGTTWHATAGATTYAAGAVMHGTTAAVTYVGDLGAGAVGTVWHATTATTTYVHGLGAGAAGTVWHATADATGAVVHAATIATTYMHGLGTQAAGTVMQYTAYVQGLGDQATATATQYAVGVSAYIQGMAATQAALHYTAAADTYASGLPVAGRAYTYFRNVGVEAAGSVTFMAHTAWPYKRAITGSGAVMCVAVVGKWVYYKELQYHHLEEWGTVLRERGPWGLKDELVKWWVAKPQPDAPRQPEFSETMTVQEYLRYEILLNMAQRIHRHLWALGVLAGVSFRVLAAQFPPNRDVAYVLVGLALAAWRLHHKSTEAKWYNNVKAIIHQLRPITLEEDLEHVYAYVAVQALIPLVCLLLVVASVCMPGWFRGARRDYVWLEDEDQGAAAGAGAEHVPEAGAAPAVGGGSGTGPVVHVAPHPTYGEEAAAGGGGGGGRRRGGRGRKGGRGGSAAAGIPGAAAGARTSGGTSSTGGGGGEGKQ